MHYNGKIRNGKYTVGHKMTKKKRKQKHKTITKLIKDNRTMDIIELIEKISVKLRGMYSYYGINGMWKDLHKLYYHTRYALISAMMRRSQMKKRYRHMLCILKKIPLIRPKIYKDIWCWNI